MFRRGHSKGYAFHSYGSYCLKKQKAKSKGKEHLKGSHERRIKGGSKDTQDNGAVTWGKAHMLAYVAFPT